MRIIIITLMLACFLIGMIVGLNQKVPEYYSEIHYRTANMYENTETGVTIYLSKGEFYADGSVLVKVVRHKNDSGTNVRGYGQSRLKEGK